MNNQKTTKTKNFQFIFITTIIFIFFFAITISALTSFFARQRKEEIKLIDKLPTFNIERTGGNNEDKILLPISVPNLNQAKYNHLINIDHKAILNANGMEITTPLFLKLTIAYNTQNTFTNPEQYFNSEIKVNNLVYDNNNKPRLTLQSDGIGILPVRISIEQKEIITSANPKMTLICDYDLVDAKGTSFTGGSQTIANNIV